jgi:hypothetical protein
MEKAEFSVSSRAKHESVEHLPRHLLVGDRRDYHILG